MNHRKVNEMYSGNILYGKKWTVCGDSFSHGDFTGLPEEEWYLTEGRYKGQMRVYPYFIGNRNDMEIVNLAINGETLARLDRTRTEYKRRAERAAFAEGDYEKIPEDSDYITFYFGINDWHQDVPVGTPGIRDPYTFYGAWNTILPKVIEKCPFAHIGIIITNGSSPEYTEAERVIAEKYGIPCLDLERDVRVPLTLRAGGEREGLCDFAEEARRKAFSVSDTNGHPNPKAHEYESTFIENFLRSL